MENIGVSVPEILLPAEKVDLTKWAVVACDQFTSQPEYWEELERFVGEAPSTLHITFPEVYLGGDNTARISRINCTMERYLAGGVFTPMTGFLLTSRVTPQSGRRLGLVLSVDLEQYGFRLEDRALIRATEGTILSRIPPRMEIRRGAPLESPHIMLLIDDRKRTVIEPLYEARKELPVRYDFDLNGGGGHLTGWQITDTESVARHLAALLDPALLRQKYNKDERFLFAVGDGNHSLATAKACWEEVKQGLTPAERESHPARHALVEVVNLYDDGLLFQPIHRVVFGIKEGFVEGLTHIAGGAGMGALVTEKEEKELSLPANAAQAVAAVQTYIDGAIEAGLAESVDYVHGENSVRQVVARHPASCGILLPALNKEDLFAAVLEGGALPRKTFSMGEATEKRYYLECRRIRP